MRPGDGSPDLDIICCNNLYNEVPSKTKRTSFKKKYFIYLHCPLGVLTVVGEAIPQEQRATRQRRKY
jgi:hypothetical protein